MSDGAMLHPKRWMPSWRNCGADSAGLEGRPMSIYSTLWEIKVRRRHEFDDEWVTVFAQAVPPHIGHPSCYPEGDPYADFLPPVVEYDPVTNEGPYRAVVIVQ